jgi:hypothetical protein
MPPLAFLYPRWDNPSIAARRRQSETMIPDALPAIPFAMRVVVLATALCALLVDSGCEKSPDNKVAQDQAAATQFAADKAAAAREREDMAARRREMETANQKDIHQESEAAFKKFASERPEMTATEESKTQDDVIERLRARMTDPSAMEVRNVRFNSERTALCMEVNYREGGKYLGYRRAYATPDVTWVEPAKDDVSLHVFELNFEKMGCRTALNSPRP